VIAVVSHGADEHVPPVLDALARRGAAAVVVDLGAFPARGFVSLACGPRGDWLLDLPGARVRAAELEAVWWRRPRPLAADPALAPPQAAYALRQADAALAGLWASLRVRWVNEPRRDEVAGQKPFQLALAEEVGLAVPRTLVTNDPVRARAFLDAAGGGAVVQKALHATPADWRPTALVTPEDVAALPALRFAPAVLQEEVPGVDVRVTIAGARVFAAEIDARGTSSPHDFRPALAEARVRSCALPPDVEARVRALVARLGLAYAAIDLRRRDDGEHVFLELNPGGQWRFVEERTGQPITEAVAALLAGG
jgi:glutathione synthase/RimK-type ligase-like ATP-grasp enzyme